jgi:pimeloyl-ACP methyl ester carboxylesterase
MEVDAMWRSILRCIGYVAVILCVWVFGISIAGAYEPPSEISREEIVKTNNAVLAMPDLKLRVVEDVFRIKALGLDWDVGVKVYEPEDPSKVLVGPEGKKLGLFLLHGGAGDYRSVEPFALVLAGKFGFKVTNMTFPGRLYLPDPSRNWPGDTVHPDGSVRTPMWQRGEVIGKDQYEMIQDRSRRERFGTLIMAKAKPGTVFYDRMAAWPVAFEEAMQEVCRRHLPPDQYIVITNGHSTGGPFAHYLSQRVPNVVGVLGLGSAPFGYIYSKMIGQVWDAPFNSLRIRNWRDLARYAGEGREKDDWRLLPMIMEDVLEGWHEVTTEPQLKAEDFILLNRVTSLADAARAAAKRLNLNAQETEALVNRYVGYTKELSGPGVKAVPPIVYFSAKGDRDMSLKHYTETALPMYAAMKPAPKVRVVLVGAGVHWYNQPEQDLPKGIAPAVAKYWYDTITGGYFY